MKVHSTKIQDVLIVEPQKHIDLRGSFMESWTKRHYEEVGIKDCFVQDNLSVSHQGVIRGMHSQKGMSQLVSIVAGSVVDVVVDYRQNSKTYMQYVKIELDAQIPRQVYVPEGCLHGFCVMSDSAILSYKCSKYYDPESEVNVPFNSKDLGIKWPIDCIISSKRDSKEL